MRKSIRCCISCILPCGALDVIRIVHSNGRVEELSGSIKASDIMKAHPKHVLKKPSSPSAQDGVVPKIVVVPPDAQLQRGKIYFLMPLPSRSHSHSHNLKNKRKDHHVHAHNHNHLANERYLTHILSENLSLSTHTHKRPPRLAVWRPHLDTISESPPHLEGSAGA